MNLLILALMVAALASVALIYKSLNTKRLEEKNLGVKFYQAKKHFFTKSEYVFFQELEKQNERYYVFSKVRLEDIAEVVPGLDRKVAYGKRNSIKSRHVDFVLVSKDSGEIERAIELDGKSHRSLKQKESDNVKDEILRQVGLPLHRISVGSNFSEEVTRILNSSTGG